MRAATIIASALGIVGTALFTWLLVAGVLSDPSYVVLVVSLAMVCIALLCLPRILELDLKNLKLTLSQLRQVKSDIDEVKSEIVEMYGGIENLRKAPLTLDDRKMKDLGLKTNAIPAITAVMRYTAGCIKRERERLARVFVSPKAPERLAEAIIDGSLDDKVFKWNGPEIPLDSAPESLEERATAKEGESKAME